MKLQKMCKKVISALCTVTMLISMCSMFALAAGNPAYGNIDIDREQVYDTDLSVMSFNVLQSDTNYFETPDVRINGILTIIETYQPDVVGMQEVSQKAVFADGGNWYDKLSAEMSKLGYSHHALTDDLTLTMDICDGLVLFYKTERFTVAASNAENMPASVSASYTHIDTADDTKSNTYNYSHTSDNRYYQYVRLVDKEHNNQPVHLYNTHLAIQPDTARNIDTGITENISNLRYQNADGTYTSIPIAAALARKERTVQIKYLKTKMDAHSATAPVIALGDFNSAFSHGYSNSAMTTLLAEDEQGVLHIFDNNLQNGTDTYYDTARMALHQVSTSYSAAVDHIFVNAAFFDIADFRTIREAVGGRRPSDHFPILVQLSYRAATTAFGPGDYDFSNGTYTDKVDNSEYTFAITPATPFTVKILQNGVVCDNTVSLNKTINKFDINFYVGDALYDTIPATIHYTGADKPILQTENAVNHYFANNAYHVVVENDINDIIIRPVGGKLYKNEACTDAQNNHFYNVPKGRTIYYVGDTSTGDVYPLYIYKETKPAFNNELVLYVDDDFGTAVGTVAFWDGEDVSLVTANKNGFDSFDELNRPVSGVSTVNVDTTDNYIVYVSPGTYRVVTENTAQAVNSDVYNRSMTILGPNHNIEPNIRDMDGTWILNPNRRPEAVIVGMLRFASNPDYNELGPFKVTVKGLKFEGKTSNASIWIDDQRATSTDAKTKVEERTGFVTEFDIQNNIFTASGYHFNSSAICANTSSQKTGVIAKNYFKNVAARILDERAPYEAQYEGNDYFRSIFLRNPNGLIIDGNRFVDIHNPLWMSSEIQDLNPATKGNLSYTMQDNRFENCGSAYLWATALGEGTENNAANIKYYNNDFIRCGSATGGPAISLQLVEHSTSTESEGNHITVPTDYSKINIDIQGNNFYDCLQSIHIYRSASERDPDNYADFRNLEHIGDINDMTLKITENRFINPTEDKSQKSKLLETIQFNFYLNAEDAAGSTNEERELSDEAKARWDLSHNFFTSKYIIDGADDDTADVQNPNNIASATSAHDPKYFVDNSISILTEDGQNYTNNGVSFLWEDAFAPYYLDYELNELSDGTTAEPFTGITATGYEAEYDGLPHGITVNNVPDGSIVSYSLDEEEADPIYKPYTAHNPTFTDVCGPVTVYYKVEKTGMITEYGQATVTITPNTAGRTGLEDTTVTYKFGKEQTLTPFADPEIEDHYVYTYNGITYSEMPAFTEVGTYEITVVVTNANYATFVDSAVLTIEKADLSTYTLTGGYNGYYTGANRTVTVSGLPTDVTVEYSIDGGEWTTTRPSYTVPTDGHTYSIVTRLRGANYVTHTFDAVEINILPALIEDVNVTANDSIVSGTPQDLLNVTKGATDDTIKQTTVLFSVNGHEFTATEPTFTKAGTYVVAVKFSRPYHEDKLMMVTVNLTDSPTRDSHFVLSIREKLIRPNETQKYTITWELDLDITETGITASTTQDFKVTEYGIVYASTLDNLVDYSFYKKNGITNADSEAAAKALITNNKIQKYVYDSSEVGFTKLYHYNTYHVYNTKPLKARYAMFYIVYEIDGVVYEEYSAIDCTSTMLEQYDENGENTLEGIIAGIGDTSNEGNEILTKAP